MEKRHIGKKEKSVERNTNKKSEREAQPKREASRAKARRGKQNGIKKANGKQNGMRIPCGSLCSPQEPLAGLIWLSPNTCILSLQNFKDD